MKILEKGFLTFSYPNTLGKFVISSWVHEKILHPLQVLMLI